METFTEEEIFFWDGFMGITRLSFVDRKAHGAFTFFNILAQYIVECQPLNTRFTFVKESLISYYNFLCPDEDKKGKPVWVTSSPSGHLVFVVFLVVFLILTITDFFALRMDTEILISRIQNERRCPIVASYKLSDIDWFEWNGVKCTDYGMHVLAQPDHISPAEKASTIEIPGRSGTLTQLEGTDIYSDLGLSCTCVVDDPYYVKDGSNISRISEITNWLRGSGTIKFANRTEGCYYGRIANQISFSQIVRGDPHRSFSIQFRCNPFLYLDSGNTPIEVGSDPVLITNAGNVTAQPLIKVTGTSEGSIMIGNQTMLVNDFSNIGYILIDCEAKIAYKGAKGSVTDPLMLLSTRITGEWIEIPTGQSYITLTGGITSAMVTPRWRCI
jgi:phage-related protein